MAILYNSNEYFLNLSGLDKIDVILFARILGLICFDLVKIILSGLITFFGYFRDFLVTPSALTGSVGVTNSPEIPFSIIYGIPSILAAKTGVL